MVHCCTIFQFLCFFYHGHPCFRNFNSTIPVHAVSWVKSYVDSFLDPICVPVRILINKLDIVPNRIVAGLVDVFRNGGGPGRGESYIPVMFFDPLLYRSPCFPNVDSATLAGNPVHYAILFSWVDGILWSHYKVEPKCHVRLKVAANVLLF